MNPIKRLTKFIEKDFNEVMTLISNGSIKCGKYSDLIKIDKNSKMKGTRFFENGKRDKSE